MSISKSTRSIVDGFATALVKDPLEELIDGDVRWPSVRSGRIGGRNSSKDQGWLFLVDEEFSAFERCLDALTLEPELEHFTRKDVDRELMELATVLVGNREKYSDREVLANRIDEFVSTVSRPQEPFEVMYAIDGIIIVGDPIRLGKVEFFHLSEEKARSWGIGDHPPYDMAKNLIGSTVAQIKVQAGSSAKARERAGDLVEFALQALKVCISSFESPRIRDMQLLQRRGIDYAVKQFKPVTEVLPGWSLGFRAVDLTLDGQLKESTMRAIELLEPVLQGRMPGARLGGQFERALGWIGSSIARESYDDKVIDLCTALECLLTTKDDQWKGEAISFRYMLLAFAVTESFFNPMEMHRLYELRSEVVHGSARGICTETDYRTLWYLARTTMQNSLSLLEGNLSITTPRKLIVSIESEEYINQARDWLAQNPRAKKLKDYMEKRFNRSGTPFRLKNALSQLKGYTLKMIKGRRD